MKRAWVALALGLCTVLVGAVGALRWTLIPEHVDTRVHKMMGAEEGPPFRVLILEDGRVLTVDTQVVKHLAHGEDPAGIRLRKDAWATTLKADGRTIHLGPSGEFWRMLATLAAVALVAAARFCRLSARRGPSDRAG